MMQVHNTGPRLRLAGETSDLLLGVANAAMQLCARWSKPLEKIPHISASSAYVAPPCHGFAPMIGISCMRLSCVWHVVPSTPDQIALGRGESGLRLHNRLPLKSNSCASCLKTRSSPPLPHLPSYNLLYTVPCKSPMAILFK